MVDRRNGPSGRFLRAADSGESPSWVNNNVAMQQKRDSAPRPNAAPEKSIFKTASSSEAAGPKAGCSSRPGGLGS
jgi:hypothetical protein